MELPSVSVGESIPSAQRPPNRLLQALPEADYAALHRHLEVAVLVRNAVLVEAGGALTHVYLPHAGAVSMVVNLSDGQTVEVAMIGRDGVVGASTALVDGISLSDVVVLFPGTASTLDTALFRAAAERSAALRNLLARHEQALIAQAVQSAACNASHSVEARACRDGYCARANCTTAKHCH
jgi:CRP-like cAMP-binding protein